LICQYRPLVEHAAEIAWNVVIAGTAGAAHADHKRLGCPSWTLTGSDLCQTAQVDLI